MLVYTLVGLTYGSSGAALWSEKVIQWRYFIPLVFVTLCFLYWNFYGNWRTCRIVYVSWNMKWEGWYMMSYIGLWEGSKWYTCLKRKGSLTWCVLCFPKKAMMYFNPEILWNICITCVTFAYVDLLFLWNWQIRLALDENQIIHEAISCLVNYWRECLVRKTCLQFAGSPPISLNSSGILGLNYLPGAQQFLKAG